MNTLIEEAQRTWADPHARHALLGHVPLVLGILGFLPLLLLALTGFRSAALKVTVILWFMIAAGGAWFAYQAGEEAEHAVEARVPALSDVEKAALERHEWWGKKAWIWPLVPAGLGLFMLARGRSTQIIAGTLTLVTALGVGAAISLTGHSGGRLVYLYGLGVPERGAPAEGTEAKGAAPPAIVAPPTATAPTPSEPPPAQTQPAEPPTQPSPEPPAATPPETPPTQPPPGGR